MTTACARLLTGVVLAAGMASCSKEKPSAPAAPVSGVTGTAPAKPNVVLITMEATRADHLGCYGNSQVATPNLDQLAHEGAIFSKAFAVAPLTLPSTVSILTSLYPPRHHLRGDIGYFFAKTTFAEHLKAQGYATAAVVGTHVLAGELGLGRGFDSYAEARPSSRTADAVVDDAIAAVSRLKGGPFFLWVELDDPQAPYTPPPNYRARFQNRPYDGEISWMDSQLKRLFDHLRASGVYDSTIVTATADHGESLGEHGEETHGLFVYDSTLKVPLIVRYPPRIPAGTKFDDLVSGVDLPPTLLALMNLPALPSAQGESCAARLSGQNAPKREAVYSESLLGEQTYGWVPLHALRSQDEKFIDGPEPELYNLKRDPSETINLASTDAAIIASTWRPSMDEAYRAAGVVEAEATKARQPQKTHRNVSGLVAAHNLYLRAEQLMEAGHPEQAAPLLRQAMTSDPGNPVLKTVLETLRAAPLAGGEVPNTFTGQWELANALYVKRKLPEAAKAFRAALALNPKSADAHYALGNVLAEMGDDADAIKELKAAVSIDPKMSDGWNKLGIILDKTSRRPEALAAFSSALEAMPDRADSLFNRAKIELLEGKLPDARRDVDRLLAVHAEYPAGHFIQAHLCAAEGNNDCAKAALTKYLTMPNTDPRMKAAAADMLKRLGG